MKPITMVSEQTSDYTKALDDCETLEQLRELLASYRPIASDAEAAIPRDEQEFGDFRTGLLSERRRKFAGEEWMVRYGSLLMPHVMVEVSLVAMHFMVPWGLAFSRMKDVGRIRLDRAGVAQIVKEAKA